MSKKTSPSHKEEFIPSPLSTIPTPVVKNQLRAFVEEVKKFEIIAQKVYSSKPQSKLETKSVEITATKLITETKPQTKPETK